MTAGTISIAVSQLWPGPTPVDAVKNATINGVIENYLEGKCFNRQKESHISCRAHYKNEEQKNEFFMSLEMDYEKLINLTEQVKKYGEGRGRLADSASRRFRPPWTAEEYRGISYVVRDANNFAVAYVYLGRTLWRCDWDAR